MVLLPEGLKLMWEILIDLGGKIYYYVRNKIR